MTGALLVLTLAVLPQDALPLETYRTSLEAARDALDRGDVAEASRLAEGLVDRKIVHDGIEFSPDPAIVEALTDASDPDAIASAKERLKTLLAALEETAPADPKARPVDRALLEQLRREEEPLRIQRGGELGTIKPEPPKTLVDKIVEVLEWIGERLRGFFDWLFDLFRPKTAGGGSGFSGLQALVWILVIAGIVVLGIVAFLALRNRGGSTESAPAASTAPLRSARDEDPLSRSASGWEAHAAELMKAGQYREAIRAWYHAVLVTCFRAGLLHYRKDRTNWEYAYSLGPDYTWRPRFMEATRSFEREWYGRRATNADTATEFQGDASALLEIVRGGGIR